MTTPAKHCYIWRLSQPPPTDTEIRQQATVLAVLQLLAKDGLTIDTKISPYIYGDWTQGHNVKQLTFKELLTHTSGFGQVSGCGNDITYAALKALVAGGVQSSNIGAAQ